MKKLCITLLACFAANLASAAPAIVGYSGGNLIGSNLTAGTTATVEWASTAAGPWTNTWANLAAIPVGSNGVISVPVPFFYRLQDAVSVATTTTSTTSSSTTASVVITTTSTSTSAAPPSGAVVAFVGFNADGNDDFALVALTPVPASAEIFFTDKQWNGQPLGAGGAFDSVGEGFAVWNTGPGVAAGTVVAFTNTSLSSRGATVGTLTGNIALAASDEGLFVYEGTGTNNPTAILAGISNNGLDVDAVGSLSGTGLDTNTTFVAITGNEDIAAYTGPRTGFSGAAYLPLIANTSNWITEDGTGDQSTNAVAPDVPFSLTPFTP